MSAEEGSAFRVEVEWLPVRDIRAPELLATWARLQIFVGHACVTQVEDVETGVSRRSILVPLYPLAEWVAFNWWLLQEHVRPSFLPSYNWTFRARVRHGGPRTNWLRHHNLRAIGDGFAWPNLSILPQDGDIRLAWRGDSSPPSSGTAKFLTSGTAEVDASNVMAVLMQLVDDTVIRLTEAGLAETPLQQEWSALREVDAEEVEFNVAAARLGLDPYAVSDEVSELILQTDEQLSASLFEDFLVAATPTKMRGDLEWIQGASETIRAHHSMADPIPTLQPGAEDVPWEAGFSLARQFRHAVGLRINEPIQLDQWLPATTVEGPDRALQALGALSGNASPILALARSRVPYGRRFAQGRSLYRFATGDQEHLIVEAHTARQQAERAFAAELLAPAAGIRELVRVDDGLVGNNEVASLGEHYGVSEWVIRYQLINQLRLEVDDPETLTRLV